MAKWCLSIIIVRSCQKCYKTGLYRLVFEMSRQLNYYPNFVLEHPNPPVELNFKDIFGRSAPVHIEIGSGKGTFLVNQAKYQPDANFIGIEWAGRYYRFAVDRIGRWNLTNVRIIRTDAVPYIAECVPDSSVDCFHIYFPDPWPKKRHNKRRFFNSANSDQLIRCLKTRRHYPCRHRPRRILRADKRSPLLQIRTA